LVHQQIVNYFQEASFSGVFIQGSDGTTERDMLSSPTTTIQRYFSRIGILSIALFAFIIVINAYDDNSWITMYISYE